MALIIKDRVKETTTTTGTGTITLAGASTGFRSFADIGNANTTYYTIAGQGTNEWEVGLGTYTASGTTLSRDTVLSNSLGTTALINFSAGTKDVFVTYPSGKAILGDTSAVASTGTGSVVLSDSPTFTTAITSTGALQLTGSATVNQNIATAQTTGTLAIGGTGASTGAITLGQSTGSQSINISNGAISTSIVNIGGTGASTGNINIGRSTGNQTISIGSGASGSTVTSSGTRTINIGTTSAGTGISNVSIGKYSSSVNHATSISGRTVNLTAETLTLNNIGALSIGSNLAQTTMFVADLGSLTGVVKGSRSFVTDNSITPVFNAIATDGGGTGFATPIFYDGTNWRCG